MPSVNAYDFSAVGVPQMCSNNTMAEQNTKKIVVLGLSYPFRGGIAHYSTLFVRELRKKYIVSFLTLKRQYPKWFFPGRTQYDNSEEPIVEENFAIIDSINPFTWLRAALWLGRENCDLIVVQWWHPFFALAFGTIINMTLIIRKKKVCCVCHNVLPHENTIFDRILLKYAFARIKYFIVHSDEDKNNLILIKKDSVIKKNLHPTYSHFGKQSVLGKKEARIAVNINPFTNVILFFGLVRKYKGLNYLICAMPEILRHIDCTLLIVGEFYESKDRYLSLIKSLNIEQKVAIVDKYIKNEDIPLYFACADVVVLPYIEATQSGIVQIAFGLGKPVITTNVGGLPEAVENELTGFVVESKSSQKLSEAVVRYYHENCEERFVKKIVTTSKNFSWDIEIKNIDFFLNCLSDDVQ